MLRLAAAALSLSLLSTGAAQVPTAITTDPTPDKASPAAMESFQLPSHGALLNAFLYEAAGAGPHGTVVLLHGFPGNEKNLDVAQAARRAGWNVLYLDYRGSWGSPGAFSFAHSIEDAQAALVYLRDPANAKRLRVNPDKLVLMGHSMGGMIAAYVGAHDPKIAGVALISAADMAGFAQLPAGADAATKAATQAQIAKTLAAEGMAPLAGCTPDGLAAELMAHPEWILASDEPGLENKPVLIVTSDDGLAEPASRLSDALSAQGNGEVRYVHLASDHAYSNKRLALTQTLLGGLDYLNTR